MTNKCYICGTERNLKLFKNIKIKTTGFLVPIEKGYICKEHENRILIEKIKIIDRWSGDIQWVDKNEPDLKLDYIKRRFEIFK